MPKQSIESVRTRFNKDIEKHELSILNDNGVHRCLKFSRPESSNYAFYITTWPGHLCISGDMGCVVFNRLYDMFEFFRGEGVNLGYWREKIVSSSEFGKGAMAWDSDLAEEVVLGVFNEWKEEKLADLESEISDLRASIAEINEELLSDAEYDRVQGEAEIADLNSKINDLTESTNSEIEEELDKIKSELLWAASSEQELGLAYSNYESSDDGANFSDFNERFSSCYDYTFHYIWQCLAIVYAISKYDGIIKEKKDARE